VSYKSLTQGDLEKLREICPGERVLYGEEINEDYCRDELGEITRSPDVLIKPVQTEEVSSILNYAHREKIPVTVRGAGTGLCGGSVPLEGGILISLEEMNRILEIDTENLTATVEPGVILLDFQKLVEERALFYPPDPGEKTATLGGNVMTNAGGMRALRYGVTRDYVLGLEAVLPDGEIIKTGGKVVKNSSGYSLKDLLIGSEGTLAIVTEITLKLLPLPRRQLSLLVPFSDLNKAIEAVPSIIKQREIPAALEFMEREVILAAEEYLGRSFPHSSSPAYLLLSFYGNNTGELTEVYEEAAHTCLQAGAQDVLIASTPERQEALWSLRGAFLEALKGMSELDECDVVVPRDKIAHFISFASSLKGKYGLRILSFGHAGDGNLHIYLLKDSLPQNEWQEKRTKTLKALFAEAKRIRGQVSGEHGIGYAKKDFLPLSLGPKQIDLMRGIKRTFDPGYILNPGKIF